MNPKDAAQIFALFIEDGEPPDYQRQNFEFTASADGNKVTLRISELAAAATSMLAPAEVRKTHVFDLALTSSSSVQMPGPPSGSYTTDSPGYVQERQTTTMTANGEFQNGRAALLEAARELGINVPEGCADTDIAAAITEERAAMKWQQHLDALPDSESRVRASLQLADRLYGGTHSWGDRIPYDPKLIPSTAEEDPIARLLRRDRIVRLSPGLGSPAAVRADLLETIDRRGADDRDEEERQSTRQWRRKVEAMPDEAIWAEYTHQWGDPPRFH